VKYCVTIRLSMDGLMDLGSSKSIVIKERVSRILCASQSVLILMGLSLQSSCTTVVITRKVECISVGNEG
jgi:hypothetical protein